MVSEQRDVYRGHGQTARDQVLLPEPLLVHLIKSPQQPCETGILNLHFTDE